MIHQFYQFKASNIAQSNIIKINVDNAFAQLTFYWHCIKKCCSVSLGWSFRAFQKFVFEIRSLLAYFPGVHFILTRS